MGLLTVLFSFAVCYKMARYILDSDAGSSEMQRLCGIIKQGSNGFLRVQYSTIFRVSIVVAVLLVVIYLLRADGSVFHAVFTAFAFLLGCFCSALAGYTGVW